MFSFLQKKSTLLLGLDINPYSIKMIELSYSQKTYHVNAYASVLLPEAVFEGAVIEKIELMSEALKQLFEQNHFSTHLAALAVPDSAVISKTIQIGESVSDDVESFVMGEAEKFVPYPIDEVNLDFEVIGTSTKNSNLQDLLIVASRAENIDSRISVLEEAGLLPKVIDVESYAIERAMMLLESDLPDRGVKKTIVVFDVGYIRTTLYALNDMKIIFSREEEFGVKQLVERISEFYHMSLEAAKSFYERENVPSNFEQEVMEPYIQTLIVQMKRSLQFFFSSTRFTSVDLIILSGALTQSRLLLEQVEEQFHIPAKYANPFKEMTIESSVESTQLVKNASTWLIACGLAMRSWE